MSAVLHGTISLVGLLLAGLVWLGDRHPAAGIALLVVTAVAAVAVFAHRLGMPRRIEVHLVPALLFVPCAIVGITSGGDATGALVTLMLVPVIALGQSGPKGSLAWAAACLLVLAGAAVASRTALGDVYPRDALAWEVTRYPLIAMEIALLTSIGLVFEWLRRRSLAEADASREELVRSEARYRALAENAGVVVCELDADGRIVFASRNAREVFGRPSVEIVGSDFVSFVHPEDLGAVAAQLADAERGKTPRRTTHRVRHADGRWLHVANATFRETDESGAVRIMTVTRDVTDQREILLAARRSERLSFMDTLSASIAHQLNNPLGAILAASELAKLDLEAGDREGAAEAIDDINAQARRSGEIVERLLRFSRAEDADHRAEDIGALCAQVRDMTSGYASQRSVVLDFEPLDAPQPVRMNPVEIEQVLVNLVRNAVEASPRVERRDRAREPGEPVRIVVHDEGPGIDPAPAAPIRNGVIPRTTVGTQGAGSVWDARAWRITAERSASRASPDEGRASASSCRSTARSALLDAVAHGQVLETDDEARRDPLRLADDLPVLDPARQLLDDRALRPAGEVRPHAEVLAVAEGEVPVRASDRCRTRRGRRRRSRRGWPSRRTSSAPRPRGSSGPRPRRRARPCASCS